METYLLTWALLLLAGTGVAAATLGWPRHGFAITLNLGAGGVSGLLLAGTLATIIGGETAADVLPGGKAIDALHWELLRSP